MCGILGHINLLNEVKINELETACKTLKHRGPDASGAKKITKNIGLGHTRLSFLDLSEQGAQPMVSNDENISITFNGEIYNYIELKTELKAHYQFKSNSDTEVLLAAYQVWGIEMLHKLEGMFAFALNDIKANTMYLVRDRFGIKPLYYYTENKNLIFASELKAIHSFPSFKKEMDWSSFCDYFVYRYIPSPKTIWQNTYKVPPANYIEINTKNLEHKAIEYWTPKQGSDYEKQKNLINFVGNNLNQSISKHARADVPIGSFLSGGYDSSAIVSYLKKQNYSPKTFSIGFSNWQKSEDYFAKIVANHLQLENKTVVADENSLSYIEKMPQVYDEPIADISIIPTYMVSKLARTEVKAVMSGEGADEIFGGYHWQKEFYNITNPIKFKDKIKAFFNKIDTVDFYANAMAMGWFDTEELKKMLHPNLQQFIPKDVHWFYRKHFKKELSPLKSIQFLDMKCFMGELVLTKVDRASMANSLEVRVPFLNHQLYETVFNSKESDYYKTEETKHLLFQNIKNDLPKVILDRNKQGFVGPDSYYMNKDWYKNQLKNSTLVQQNIIKQSYIDDLLKKDYDWRIWKILVMEKWFAHWCINE